MTQNDGSVALTDLGSLYVYIYETQDHHSPRPIVYRGILDEIQGHIKGNFLAEILTVPPTANIVINVHSTLLLTHWNWIIDLIL